MTDLEDLGPLQLSVRDFGPIAEADIELRPLTVFIGRSNTGKSYLATLIHALHQVFQDDGSAQGWRRGVWPSIYPERWIMESEISAWGLDDWFSGVELEADTPATWNSLKDSTVPKTIGTSASECEYFFQGTDVLVAELERCFGMGAEIQELVRHHGSEAARASLVRRRNESIGSFDDVRFEFSMDRQGEQSSRAFFANDEPFRFHMRGEGRVPKKATTAGSDQQAKSSLPDFDWATEIVCDILMSFTQELAGPLSHSSYYLPADRAGVIHMNRAVVGLLLRESASRRREPTAGIPTLSGIAVDFLAGLVEMEDVAQKREGEGESFAKAIEHGLLRGSVGVKSGEGNYPTFSYRPGGWEYDLPLTRSASMVSELIPIVLYLRYKIKPGETLIVEEPEASLHPEAQAELVLLLARMVRAGIRVIITTHSDWILEQFANLLRMSDLEEDEREGLPGADAVLTREQFGAWLFATTRMSEGQSSKRSSSNLMKAALSAASVGSPRTCTTRGPRLAIGSLIASCLSNRSERGGRGGARSASGGLRDELVW